jgi:tetratricopeptide (TPR) repeat protein
MSQVQVLLKGAGFPIFELDEAGFPQPGLVIKEFRRRMVYSDSDGKKRRWTQEDLANALQLSKDMVALMETKNIGLDSISRRRAIAQLLKIPPVFLGLGSLSDLEFHLKSESFSQVKSGKNLPNIQLFKDALSVHWDMHYAGVDTLEVVDEWLQKIKETENPSLSSILAGYYQLKANIHGDKLNYAAAFELLDSALEIASQSNDKTTQTSIMYRFTHIRMDQRKFTLAKDPADAALSLVRFAPPTLAGSIYQASGLVYALTAQDESDRKKALDLLDKAGELTTGLDETTDEHYTRFNYGRYCLERADTLLTIKKPMTALTLLDDADEGIPTNQRRRKAYIKILRAEAYMKLKKPEWDNAAYQLQEALNDSVAIRSDYTLGCISRLLVPLSASSYGNSLEVARLRQSMKEQTNL